LLKTFGYDKTKII